jgi:hypothetical protein
MKKFLSLLLIGVLSLAIFGCSSKDTTVEVQEDYANPISVTISIVDSDEDELTVENFTPIENAEFTVEDGTSVLDATQVYCVSNDIPYTLDSTGNYFTSINGLTEKEITAETGWIYKINGNEPTKGAKDVNLVNGDKISWEFIDFASA